MPAPKKSTNAAVKADTPIRDMPSFDALIAQREEATGATGGTFPIHGFGREWKITAPDLASAEWNGKFADLRADAEDGIISHRDFADEFLNLFLGDDTDDFVAACETANDGAGIDPVNLVTWALQDYGDRRRANPTRARSSRTRKRAKRR